MQQRDDENSGRDLRVLGKHLFLVVGLAVKDAFRLSVVVQPVNKIQGWMDGVEFNAPLDTV